MLGQVMSSLFILFQVLQVISYKVRLHHVRTYCVR